MSTAKKRRSTIGLGFNATDAAVHVPDQIEGTSNRTQTYITAGIFQRASDRFSWGLVLTT